MRAVASQTRDHGQHLSLRPPEGIWGRGPGSLKSGSVYSAERACPPGVWPASSVCRDAPQRVRGFGPRGPVGTSTASSACSCLFPTDVAFITTVTFVWKVSAITMVSCLPLYVLKYLKRKLSPPSYSKLMS